jgi:glycosyltransferase involved in cell wall biosynthesis
MTEHTNTFSVVIPTHNRLEDLQQALTSVFSQTVKPLEIIVVDDGSTPKVSDDIFATAPDETRTLLLRNESPKGAPHARNRGIEAASGSWIAFLDDDDEFKPNKIEQITNHIQQNPGCELISHPADIHMVNEGVTYTSRPRQFTPEDDIFKSMLIKNEIGGTPMVAAKKKILIEAGKFQESMPALQDYELWLRVARITTHFSLLPLPLTICHYRSQKKSVSKSIKSNQSAIRFIEKKYSKEYKTFSKDEIKKHDQWKSRMLIHKSILNGDIFSALGHQLKHLIHYPSLYNLMALCAILAGPEFIYRMKAKLGS